MATNLDELIISLKADISGLRSSLQTATGDITKFTRGADAQVSTLRSSISRATAAVSAFVGVWAAFRTGQSFVQAGVQLEALSNRMLAATGNAAVAADGLAFVRSEAERLGLSFQTAASGFAGFAASALRSGLTLQQTKDIFTGVSEAATSMRLSAEQSALVFKALEQIAGKGTVSMEELRGQLGDSLPGAFEIAAKAMGVTTAQFAKMVADGEVVASEFLPRFGEAIRRELGGSVEEASQGAQAAFNRLGNAFFDLQAKLASSGLLDVVVDAVRSLTAALNDPQLVSGLSALVSLLSDVLRIALQVASAIGQAASAIDRAVKAAGNALFGGAFGGRGQKAIEAARGPARQQTTAAPSASPDYTLGTIAPRGESDKQKTAREKAERARQQAADALQGLRYDMLGPEGDAMAELDRRQKILEEALEKKILTEQEYRDLNLQAELNYQEKLEKIRKEALEKQQDTLQAGLEGFLNTKIRLQDKTLKEEGKSFRDSITQAANYNKTMFQISKAAALAEALLAARQSVVDAYRFGTALGGPFLGAAFAGVAAAAQAANIASIASTSFGGGGGVSAGGGGGVSSTSSDASPITNSTSRNVYITLSGDNDALYSKNTVRKLIEQISDAVGDGSQLRVSLA